MAESILRSRHFGPRSGRGRLKTTTKRWQMTTTVDATKSQADLVK
jgi:hypothetical protein